MIKLLKIGVILITCGYSASLFALQVELGSLQRKSDSEIKRLALTLSSVTAPKVMSFNKALGWLKFDVGFEQSLYHLSTDIQKMFNSKSVDGSSVRDTTYMTFLMLRMGLPWGLDSEASVFMPGVTDKFGVISSSLKWIPSFSFLANDHLFFTPAFRQSYTHTRFSQYNSDTLTSDLILSTKRIWGIPFYGGLSAMKVYGEYNKGAVRATHTRKPDLWATRYFFGLDHKFGLFKKADLALAVETAMMRDCESYSLKTTLNF